LKKNMNTFFLSFYLWRLCLNSNWRTSSLNCWLQWRSDGHLWEYSRDGSDSQCEWRRLGHTASTSCGISDIMISRIYGFSSLVMRCLVHLMWFQGFHGVYFLFIDVILVMLSHSLILQSQDVLVCSAVQW
jgi:hypothetical protein